MSNLKLDKAKLIYSIKDIAMQTHSINKQTLDVLIMELEEEKQMLMNHYDCMIPLIKMMRENLSVMIQDKTHKPD